jgi:hypothetical protein
LRKLGQREKNLVGVFDYSLLVTGSVASQVKGFELAVDDCLATLFDSRVKNQPQARQSSQDNQQDQTSVQRAPYHVLVFPFSVEVEICPSL